MHGTGRNIGRDGKGVIKSGGSKRFALRNDGTSPSFDCTRMETGMEKNELDSIISNYRFRLWLGMSPKESTKQEGIVRPRRQSVAGFGERRMHAGDGADGYEAAAWKEKKRCFNPRP
jgi:hypothetical protein